MPHPTLAEVVTALDGLHIRLWRWPNDSLGLWPPAPWPLGAAVRAHKPALLDLVDARVAQGGARPPAWAHTPDEGGWYSPPDGDEEVRFPPEGGYQLRVKPEVAAAQAARWEALSPAERERLAEACLSDDVEPWEF